MRPNPSLNYTQYGLHRGSVTALLLFLAFCVLVPAQSVRRRPIVSGGAPPTFPINGILDNFNRANGGPPLSASWTDSIVTTDGGMQVVSSTAVGNTGGFTINSSWWNVSTFGPDCEAYVTTSGTPNLGGVMIRLQAPGTAGVDGYYGQFWVGGSQILIKRIDNGAETVLLTVNSITVGAGDAIGLSAIGSSIELWWNDSGGGWVSKGSVTDATYGSSGNIGIVSSDNVGGVDDFGGGTR